MRSRVVHILIAIALVGLAVLVSYLVVAGLMVHYLDLARHEAVSTTAWEAVKTNIGANLWWIPVAAVVASLVWPPSRERIKAFFEHHFTAVKEHITGHHAALHGRLDTHDSLLQDAHAKLDKLLALVRHRLPDPIPHTTPKGSAVFDLSSLENRFRSVELDAEEALHSKVAKAIEEAAKIVMPLVPDGPVVEELLAEFDKLAAKAHRVVAVAAPVVDAADPAAAPIVAEVEQAVAAAPAEAAAVAADITGTDQGAPPA